VAGRVVAGSGSATPVRVAVPITVSGVRAGRVVVRGPAPATVADVAARVLAAAVAALWDAGDVPSIEERTRIEAELALGRRLQRSFVPLVAPEVPGWALASHYEPAREVGGDFFDIFAPRGRRHELAVVVADVTGKGIAAALLMAFARPLIHAAIDHARRPAVALERTNRILVEERRAALFITALCVYLDTQSGDFVLANAGHEPAFIIRANGWRLEEFDAPGPLLGAFPRIPLEERTGHLEPGDVLLLYTDGVTDARGPDGSRFGDDRYRSAIGGAEGATAQALVDAIVGAVRAFQADEPAADDLTLVVARRLPVRVRPSGGRTASGR
jgi:sigma-B regulation protein RsbU (phosphoserine phosphatase)